MSSHRPQLLAACWTSAGDVMPARGPATSPVDIRERVKAVGDAGYTGFGLNHADLVVARETIGLPTLAQLLDDNGISTVQLEWITNWWCTGERRRQSDAVRQDLFDASETLPVDHIKVGADDDGNPVPYEQLRQGFYDLAEAGQQTGVKIAFENTPFSHHIRTTGQAIDFVTQVGHPNGGLMLDIWHAYRGRTPYAEVTRLLPLQYLFGVELDDGLETVTGTDMEDTFDNRLLCGEGQFDLPQFIAAVRAIGWTGLWGVEHMSSQFRQIPIQDALVQARDAALTCFAAADDLEHGPAGTPVRAAVLRDA